MKCYLLHLEITFLLKNLKKNERQTSFQYRVDATFYNKIDYLFNKPPEYFCVGKNINYILTVFPKASFYFV